MIPLLRSYFCILKQPSSSKYQYTHQLQNQQALDNTQIRMYSIPKSIRKDIWYDYATKPSPLVLCPCCKITPLTPFCFEAGHIQSKKNEGSNHSTNLLPICRTCNASMGPMDWDEYILKYYGKERLDMDIRELPKLLNLVNNKKDE